MWERGNFFGKFIQVIDTHLNVDLIMLVKLQVVDANMAY